MTITYDEGQTLDIHLPQINPASGMVLLYVVDNGDTYFDINQTQPAWINRADNCQFTYNPNQEDLNSNGIGDACEDLKSPKISIYPPGSLAPVSIHSGSTTFYGIELTNIGNADLNYTVEDVATSPGASVTLYMDDMESGEGSWTHQMLFGTPAGQFADTWALSTAREDDNGFFHMV